jgi:hypothetical protein
MMRLVLLVLFLLFYVKIYSQNNTAPPPPPPPLFEPSEVFNDGWPEQKILARGDSVANCMKFDIYSICREYCKGGSAQVIIEENLHIDEIGLFDPTDEMVDCVENYFRYQQIDLTKSKRDHNVIMFSSFRFPGIAKQHRLARVQFSWKLCTYD